MSWCRGYRRVAGNLNAGTVGKSLYLWYLKEGYDTDTYHVARNRPIQDLKRCADASFFCVVSLTARVNGLGCAVVSAVDLSCDSAHVCEHTHSDSPRQQRLLSPLGRWEVFQHPL